MAESAERVRSSSSSDSLHYQLSDAAKSSYADRVFTTEMVAFPGAVHIDEKKDFTPVIEKALELGGYKEDQILTGINGGTK